MKVKSLGKSWFIRELDRVPSKDEVFELTDERAKELASDKNASKQPLVEIIEEVKKEETKKKKGK